MVVEYKDWCETYIVDRSDRTSNRRPVVRHSTFESLRLGRSSQSIASGFLRFWDSLIFKKDREFVGITVLFFDEKGSDLTKETTRVVIRLLNDP
ncbi:hypothetical protein HID58_054121 [Brassica napus]|uniref:Uncharacterized protein n=1 Tax=Brassica napus TaxID=3708 RepID=A0ABQ8AGL4_BRANA|nr:hypothetical protein HID58_054121 [Brassica napus]